MQYCVNFGFCFKNLSRAFAEIWFQIFSSRPIPMPDTGKKKGMEGRGGGGGAILVKEAILSVSSSSQTIPYLMG